PSGQACATSQPPICGGTCPFQQVCAQTLSGDACECVPAGQTCLVSQAPSCGGACPSGHCGPRGSGAACTCVCEESPSCRFVTKWGNAGSGDGEFNSPIGVAVDANGNVFVADWENQRVQKFTNTGAFLAKWGSAGSGDGQFSGGLK